MHTGNSFLSAMLVPLIALSLSSASEERRPVVVDTGLDVLFKEHLDELRGKTLGLVINQTAVDKDRVHIVDRLMEHDDITIGAIFCEEHGYRGTTYSRDIKDEVDPVSGATVYSLYKKAERLPDVLKDLDLDLIIFDMQTLNARFYKIPRPLKNVMQEAARQGIPYWVLDRPVPTNGLQVDGPVASRESWNAGSVCALVPIQYGMTIGELAKMYVGEGWLDVPEGFQPRVIEMKGWQRDRWLDETDVPWIQTSPAIPDLRTAAVYPGMCFFEDRRFCIKHYNPYPFIWMAAPFIDGKELTDALNKQTIQGVNFTPIEFDCREGTFAGKHLEGIQVNVLDRNKLEPVKMGVYILHALHGLYPEGFALNSENSRTKIDKLAGTSSLTEALREGRTPKEIFESWETPLEDFKKARAKYLIYP
jgi:uncharacterized protein YbbC (DUF1343 family)